MRRMVIIFASVSGFLLLAYLWAEVCYRRWLFFKDGAEPYLNHVESSYFVIMSLLAVVASVVLVCAAVLSFRLKNKVSAVVSVLGVLLAISNIALLKHMRTTKMLVSYAEFAQRKGP